MQTLLALVASGEDILEPLAAMIVVLVHPYGIIRYNLLKQIT